MDLEDEVKRREFKHKLSGYVPRVVLAGNWKDEDYLSSLSKTANDDEKEMAKVEVPRSALHADDARRSSSHDGPARGRKNVLVRLDVSQVHRENY